MLYRRCQLEETPYESKDTRHTIDGVEGAIDRLKKNLLGGRSQLIFRSSDSTEFKVNMLAGVLGTIVYEKNKGTPYPNFPELRAQLLSELTKIASQKNVEPTE